MKKPKLSDYFIELHKLYVRILRQKDGSLIEYLNVTKAHSKVFKTYSKGD